MGSYPEPVGLAPFDADLHSDACSGGVSTVHDTLRRLGLVADEPLFFTTCCIEHDEPYYYGRNPHQALREQADRALRQCVADKGTQVYIARGKAADAAAAQARWLADRVYGAVHRFGGPCLNGRESEASFRWGYGVDFVGR